MPEGPSIVILREEAAAFAGRPRHDIPLQRAHLGKTHRRRFFCARCQKLYRED